MGQIRTGTESFYPVCRNGKTKPPLNLKSFIHLTVRARDYAKDGGKELFTEMHCVLLSKSYRIVS